MTLNNDSVPVKTSKALEEIDTRAHRLSGRLRAVLIMVDGQRSVGELLDQAGDLADRLAGQLQELAASGFIAPAGDQSASFASSDAPAVSGESVESVAPPQQKLASSSYTIEVARARLNKLLADSLGMRAMFLTPQLNAVKSAGELEQFIDATAQGMASSSGQQSAAEWREKAREVCGLK